MGVCSEEGDEPDHDGGDEEDHEGEILPAVGEKFLGRDLFGRRIFAANQKKKNADQRDACGKQCDEWSPGNASARLICQ